MTDEKQTIRPRPGSGIWRRTDGGYTRIKHKEGGVGYVNKFPGATAEEIAREEVNDPRGWFVGESEDTFCAVEKILNLDAWQKDDTEAIVVLGPYVPPFGQWERLEEWRG